MTIALLMAVAVGASALTWAVVRAKDRLSGDSVARLTADTRRIREGLVDATFAILSQPLGEDLLVPDAKDLDPGGYSRLAPVIGAINELQDDALDLAVEQAVLRRNIADSFVNIGRRSQNLLTNQLDLITELEVAEDDPDKLALLFRLDHLATRMRRNAESLLVLVGVNPPRVWSAPVRLTDVVRASLGEVEDYQRVSVSMHGSTILGHVAADLAHIMAEFIENALAFSPFDARVELQGADGPDGYLFSVIDSGPGMRADDIETANERLAGQAFTATPSRYLGHFVAAALAERYGIGLELKQSPGGGLTALIKIPPQLTEPETQHSLVLDDPDNT